MIVKASFVQYARRALWSIILASKSDSASNAPTQPTNGELKTLSADAQRALWAQAFINCIKDQPPLFKELREQSLHERLLNMEQPFQQKLSKYVFTKEIQSEMKRYFMPKVGYSLPTEIYTQLRFEQAGRNQKQSNNISLTFYPTYSTTGFMFRKILQKKRYLLLYGRWGIGKSLSAVLCSLLYNHIDYYLSKYMLSKQYNQIKALLRRGSVIYWSINANETEQSLLKKMIYQNKKLWLKYHINEETFDNYEDWISQMKQKDSVGYTKFLQEVYECDEKRSLIIDQINVLAANKRKHRLIQQKLSYLDSSKKFEVKQQGQHMDYFKDKIRNTANYVLYNSSSNIQTSLIAWKDSEPDYKLKIGDGHTNIPIQSFKYEQRLSFEEQNIAYLELSQFFTNVLQQFVTFSHEVEEEWKNEDLLSKQEYSAKKRFFLRIQQKFRKVDWNIAPNAFLIVNQIKNNSDKLSNPKTSDELEKEIQIIQNQILINSQNNFQEKIKVFIEKQIRENSGDKVKTQNYKINMQVKKQIIERVAELLYPKNVENQDTEQIKYIKKPFFQIQIKRRIFGKEKNLQQYNQTLEYIDKEIFTVFQNRKSQQHIVVRSFMDPKYFLDSVLSIIFTDFNPNLMKELLKGQKYQKVKILTEEKMGRLFERVFINLMNSLSFNLNCPNINQHFKKYEKITIKNFVIDQQNKTLISLQEKFNEVKQQMQKTKENLFVCIPEQFKTTNQTNLAFDFAFLQNKDIGEAQRQYVHLYHFFNLTVSLNSSYLKKKIVKFMKMISNLKQIKNQPVQKQLKLKNKINFYVLGLVGKSKKLTKVQLQKIFKGRKDLFDLLQFLEIQIYELKYQDNILQKRTRDLILSNETIKDLQTINTIYETYEQKQRI